jgi:predicted metal-dependent hydrolase
MSFWLMLPAQKKYPYELVKSSRAKYIRIKLSPDGKLSVVLPDGIPAQHAHDFVQSHRDWVNRQLLKLEQNPPRFITTPDELNLRLLGEVWQIRYQEMDEQKVTLEQVPDGSVLSISGLISDIPLVKKVLGMWLKRKAVPVLNQMLEKLARQHGFEYVRCTIRGQKTRWGSCSTKGNINLNYKLLFCPREIVEYVMIHELSHTHEHNHSPQFWAIVESCDPDFQQHRQQLRELEKDIPL